MVLLSVEIICVNKINVSIDPPTQSGELVTQVLHRNQNMTRNYNVIIDNK